MVGELGVKLGGGPDFEGEVAGQTAAGRSGRRSGRRGLGAAGGGKAVAEEREQSELTTRKRLLDCRQQKWKKIWKKGWNWGVGENAEGFA